MISGVCLIRSKPAAAYQGRTLRFSGAMPEGEARDPASQIARPTPGASSVHVFAVQRAKVAEYR